MTDLSPNMRRALLAAKTPVPNKFNPDRRVRRAVEGLGDQLMAVGLSATLRALEKRGLARRSFVAFAGTFYFLTDCGRKLRESLLKQEASTND